MRFSYIALPPYITLHSILGNDVCDRPFVVCVLLHQRRPNSGCDTFSMFFVGNVLGFGGRFLREVSPKTIHPGFTQGGNPPKRSS